MQRTFWTILLNSVIILFVISTAAMSAVPPFLNYQGRLTDDGGNPIDTTAAITFLIYGDYVGDTPLWSETHPSVTVTDGLFSVLLGTVVQMPPTVFDGSDRFLAIQLGAGPENEPRVPIISVAYALRSNHADTAAYALAAPGGSSPWTSNGSAAYLNNSNLNVGIGTNSPTSKLVVDGDIWSTGTGAFGGPIFGRKSVAAYATGTLDTFAVWGTNTNGTAAGFFSGTNANVAPGTPAAVYARAGGNAIGGHFSAMGDGFGLYAFSAGSRDAFRAQTTGTQYAGRFLGGLGVKVDGNLDVAGSFKLSAGASDGHVLTSDATGVATWQEPSGGSPWTVNDTATYLTDTTLRAVIGMTAPPSNKKLSISTTGGGNDMALWVRNTDGTAASFFSGGYFATSYPGYPTAVFADGRGLNDAGLFTAEDGRGVTISVQGAESALLSQSHGSGLSGYFTGGSGVYVNGDLEVTGTTVGDGAVALPGSSISSAEILDEPGIASSFNTTGEYPLLTSQMRDLSVVTITIPTAGYILVQGRCSIRLHGTTNTNYGLVQIDETAGGNNHANMIVAGAESYYDTTSHNFGASPSAVYYKSAGTHTFRLEAKQSVTEGKASAQSCAVYALFFPGSYGKTTTIVDAAQAAEFTSAIAVEVTNDHLGSAGSQQLYQVDLRELELKAARARSEAEKAERELLEAKMREREPLTREEAGR